MPADVALTIARSIGRPRRREPIDAAVSCDACSRPLRRSHDEKAAAIDDRHRYDVSLGEGEFLEMTVSQGRFVLTLSVRGPDGAVLHSVSVPDTDPLPQYLIFIAPTAGTYSIEVTATSTLGHTERPDKSD